MSFIVKLRGVPTPRTIADYRCDVHGRFELEVERDEKGDAPDVVRCPADDDCYGCGGQPNAPGSPYCRLCDGRATPCNRDAIWCISAPLARVRRVEAVKGKSQKPERKTWTDTTSIGEGQPLYEWREDRDKIWEEKRKEDVMRFAKEH